jgi:hypothetical protein
MYPLRYHKESGTSRMDAVNYIVELVSQRKARSDGILLEPNYWRDALWQQYYKEQKRAAQSLLGVFGESVVVSTIVEMKGVWSLRPKFVKDKIIENAALEQAKESLAKKREEEKPEVVEPSTQTGKGRSRFNGKKTKD